MGSEILSPLSAPEPESAGSEQAVVRSTEPSPASQEQPLWARLSVTDWIVLVCLLVLFGPMFHALYALWSDPQAPQAYGLLILPAALALVWMMRSRLVGVPVQPAHAGLIPTALGIGCLLLGTTINALTISGFGFVLTIWGVVLTRYGWPVVKKLWFPLGFLLAMVPLPHEFLNVITFPLQGISVKGAALLLTPLGDVVTRGTRIFLHNYTLDVVAPCSGLTIVLPLFVLSLYYLYMVDAPLWKKGILVLLTIPVAMAVNAVRVALIGVVGEFYGATAADTFHDYSGLITVAAGFAVLILIAQEIKCSHISEEITL